ncbi:hypothetical protein [Sporosarcina sp. A2]|uniref:hypothetical protein n=1 Tax=Sporosarcina sp. A2 TaxID=3393449 RepID=UPI003D79FF35
MKLLQGLRDRGIEVRDQVFEEGRKYTRIYSVSIIPTKWEDVDLVMHAMKSLYEQEAFQTLLEIIEETIDDREEKFKLPVIQTPIEQAFADFVESQEIEFHLFNLHKIVPSFVMPEWTEQPISYMVLEKFCLGYPLVAWFRQRNSAVRLIIEVRPIAFPERTKLLKGIEEEGIRVRALAFEEGWRFTRIYFQEIPIEDIENSRQIARAMDQLVSSLKFQQTI